MQLEVIDKFGNVRRLRPGEGLADGERLHVPHTFMDANSLAARDSLAQKYGQHAVRDHEAEAQTRRRGFRRGYQTFADTSAPQDASKAAAEAYESKRSRLDTSRRNISDGTPALDAKQAYDERNERLENAWRKGKKDTSDHAPPSTQDARAIADAAYADKKQRLQGAWRR
jgi:hypothetical protein